jgi:D-sedoheptulose 7-phosphate isomerase
VREVIRSSLGEAASALSELMASEDRLARIEAAAEALIEAVEGGGRVFSCGNGGSMCDAMHFAEELSGRFRNDRPALPALAISDPGHLSCTANDYGWERVFARFIEAHGRAGDALVAISTSGESENVVQAAEAARRLGLASVALTGRQGSRLGGLADVEVCTPAGAFADRVQELHIKVLHILVELLELRLLPRAGRA